MGLVQKSVDDTPHEINFLFALALDKVSLIVPSQITWFNLEICFSHAFRLCSYHLHLLLTRGVGIFSTKKLSRISTTATIGFWGEQFSWQLSTGSMIFNLNSFFSLAEKNMVVSSRRSSDLRWTLTQELNSISRLIFRIWGKCCFSNLFKLVLCFG